MVYRRWVVFVALLLLPCLPRLFAADEWVTYDGFEGRARASTWC